MLRDTLRPTTKQRANVLLNNIFVISISFNYVRLHLFPLVL